MIHLFALFYTFVVDTRNPQVKVLGTCIFEEKYVFIKVKLNTIKIIHILYMRLFLLGFQFVFISTICITLFSYNL